MLSDDITPRIFPATQQNIKRLDAIDMQLANNPGHELSKLLSERGKLEKIVRPWLDAQKLTQRISEAEELLNSDPDPELRELAIEEQKTCEQQRHALIEQIAGMLVTQDDSLIDSIYIEVRAGSGGAEAALFSGELVEAYQNYARKMGLHCEIVDFNAGETGGLRQAIVAVKGDGAFRYFGYEGGVHCVKRVPATETQGRIHTSTCTVAVLPEPAEDDFHVNNDDVDEELYCASSGPGGQNVNKVATAVRLVHRPSGLEVRFCDGRSQAQNRERAWQLLRARLAQKAREDELARTNNARRAMIGSGGRSERVRTYRFKDNIVVDERISGQFPLTRIMSGDFAPLVEALQTEDKMQRLASL